MGRVSFAALCAVWFTSATAAADGAQLGGWLGPRIFSSDSRLGYIDEAPEHPYLASAIAFGGRLAYPLIPELVPELEVAFSPTETTRSIAATARVYWFEPRLHLRYEIRPGQRIQPFALVGGGAPIALSTARQTLDSGITGSGYVGGGVRFDSLKGFVLRFDARVAFLPGEKRVIAPEVDIGLGIEFSLGRRPPPPKEQIAVAPPPDMDGDKLPDGLDNCPDRPEDADGVEDGDGCPDIDDDLDRILDIADRCRAEAETYNGYEDDDGCPDAAPADLEGLRGTIEGLVYGEGETMVHKAAQATIRKISKVMTKHPSIRIVLIGHTDDREAKQFASADPNGAAQDIGALSADLALARAEVVKQALTATGIAGARIDVESRGADEPVAANERPRGRLANRRVEIRLYVPPSAGIIR